MLPCAMDFRFLNEPELHRGHGAFRFCDEVNMLDCPLVERNRPIGVILADRRRNEEAARQFHIYCNVLACIKLSGKIPFIGGIVEDIVMQVFMRLHSVVPQTSLHGRLGEDVCIIPVVLRQGCGIVAAMLHENARAHDPVDAFLRTTLSLNRDKVCLRQYIRQLILRVFALGMEADAGNLHGSILLAVHKTGKAHDPRLIHAHRIAIKVLYKLRLYHAETLHFGGRIHEPVQRADFET